MALPSVEEPWSLTACSRRRLTLGMLVHVVVGKSMIPRCFSAGAASGDPSHPTAALGGMFSGGGNQEIGVPRRVPRACEGPGDSSELKAAVSELCTCVTNPPC